MGDDPFAARASTAPAFLNRGPKLSRKVLKRLTKIPPHKMQPNHRSFPKLPANGSTPDLSALQKTLEVSRPASARSEADELDKPPPANQSRIAAQESANERRKKFLTMSNLKRVFRALDLADDGYIDVDELYEAQKKLGGKLSLSEVRDVIWEVDDDMDGRLSMQDYLTCYRRTQTDEYGFEPKRFYSIVEFLLMDRDCSGEITLDEAMTTLFERQGADNLAAISADFFRAAGVPIGDEPPPGATIQFYQYYRRIGCAKTRVPSVTDLRRTFAHKVRSEVQHLPEPPRLRSSLSMGAIPPLPRLIDVTFNAFKHASTLRKPSPPRVKPAPEEPRSARRRGGRSRSPPQRLGTPSASPAPSPGVGNLISAFASAGTDRSRPQTHSGTGSNRKHGDAPARSTGGGLAPLKPVTATSGLAASSLNAIGVSGDVVTHVKERASAALQTRRGEPPAAAPDVLPAGSLGAMPDIA